MKEEDLINQIHFSNADERIKASFYLAMKGIVFHQTILDYLCSKKGKTIPIEWTDLSGELRTDKATREILYKYFATLEEYVRASISNKYEDQVRQSFWINGKGERNQIKKKINNGSSIFAALEEADFGTLMNQVKKLPTADRKELFGKVGTDDNLDAAVVLRNAVSHHRFLKGCELKTCTVDENSSDSLISNIKNLRQLLPLPYRFGQNGKGGITGELLRINVVI